MKEKTSIFKKPGVQTLIASILCALLGILLGYVILLIINPAHAGEGILAILKNYFKYSSNPVKLKYYLGSTLAKTMPLVLCAEAILFAYKAGLFNIGAAGQYTMGLMASLYFALALQMPWYVCVLAAVVAGAAWGALSGLFKALFNVNEVIAGIMLNWIGLYLTNIILANEKIMNQAESRTYSLFNSAPQALLPSWGIGKLFSDNKYMTMAIPLTIVVAIVIYIVLEKTTFGYELKATGHNKDAAKYAGMNAKKNIILTLAISGGLAGLAASFFYLSGISEYSISSSVPAMGFNGIAVAFLGGLNPIGVIVAGYFVEHITLGGGYLDTKYYSPEMADLIIAIIIYLCGFVLFLKSLMNRKKKMTASAGKGNIAQNATVTPVAENKEEVNE